ncbi:hypothetical protein JA1_001028 [Spathaspora sp. JA1]|nr:hypothetical protein JA1_001028 [Spathaspora sp. JA1]
MIMQTTYNHLLLKTTDKDMYNRKRKRHVTKPVTSSPQPEDLHYQLTNAPIQPKQEQPLEDDDKVINYLRKMHPRQTISETTSVLGITIIVSNSEAQHFQDLQPDFVNDLRKHFTINDISISAIVPGCIDRYITVYGSDAIEMARTTLYLAFILNARLNNLGNSDLFTFKSPNYKLTLLLTNVDKLENQYGLKYMDKSESFTMITSSSTGVHSVFIQGDLHSLFNTLLQCCQLGLWVDCNNFTNSPIFGIHIDGALYSRTSENVQLLTKSNNKLLELLNGA